MPEPILTSLERWRPTDLDVADPAVADRIVAESRLVVAAAAPRTVKQARIAAGYVARCLAWVCADGAVDRSRLTNESVAAYLDHLAETGAAKGTVDAARSYLLRCAVGGAGLAPRPVEEPGQSAPAVSDRVRERIDSYVPEPSRIGAELWSRIESTVRADVMAAAPATVERARSMLVVTSLHLAWVATYGRIEDRYRPKVVEDFVALCAEQWSRGTSDTYASIIRDVARANAPLWWPATVRARAGRLRPYDESDLARFDRAIRAQRATRRRDHLEAAFALAVGAGVVGIEAAQVTPDMVVQREVTRVRVVGNRARVVPVRAPWGERLAELAAEAANQGDAFVLGGRSRRRERQQELLRSLASKGTNVDPRRLRFTWLVHLVQQPLPLQAMLDLSGLATPEVLGEAASWAGGYDTEAAWRTAAGRAD